MKLARSLVLAPLFLLVLLSFPALASQQAADAGQLAATVRQHAAEHDGDRAAIHDALARADVRDIASKMGVDLDRMNATVDTLTGADLARAGAAARQANQELTGGASTVVISTTTIIIALLIVILLIVALK